MTIDDYFRLFLLLRKEFALDLQLHDTKNQLP